MQQNPKADFARAAPGGPHLSRVSLANASPADHPRADTWVGASTAVSIIGERVAPWLADLSPLLWLTLHRRALACGAAAAGVAPTGAVLARDIT